MFPVPTDVKALGEYKIWLKYNDQSEGIVDLSHLSKKGVFNHWEDQNLFSKVYIDPISHAIAWNDDIDLCPDSLYLQLKGLSFEKWQANQETYATN